MNKASPRNIKDLDYDSREEPAHDSREARRSSIRRTSRDAEDWRDGRRDDEDEYNDPRREARLEAVTGHPARSRSRYAPRRVEEEDDYPPVSRRARYADPVVDPEVIVENAVESAAAIIEKRVAASERHTAKALKDIAALIEDNQRGQAEAHDGLGVVVDRLGRIENKIAQQPPASSTRPIRSALARLESRLDRLSNDDRTAEFEQALTGLDRRLDDIAQRLERDARERTEKSARPAAVQPAPRRPARRPLSDAIAEISLRQRALDDEPDEGFDEPSPRGRSATDRDQRPLRAQRPEVAFAIDPKRFDDLHTAVDKIARNLDAGGLESGERSSHRQAVMRQLDGLRREIENLGAGENSKDARRFDDIGAAIREMSQQISTLRSHASDGTDHQRLVMRQLEGLRREVDGLNQAGAAIDPARFDALNANIDQMAHELAAIGGNGRERVEQQLLLMRQMEGLRREVANFAATANPIDAERFNSLSAVIEQMARQLDATQEAQRERSDQQLLVMRQIEGLRRDIETIATASNRLDPARFDDLQGSIDGIGRQLDAVRKDQGERSEQHLAAMRQIAEAGNHFDPERLDALQGSLEAMGRRLDASRRDQGEQADQQLIVMRQMEGLRREIESLSRSLTDLAPRASVAAIETALRDLVHRVDQQRGRGVGDSYLAPVERIADELHAVIKELDPSPIVRNLHADVETIGRRLDNLQTPGAAQAPALEELSRQTSEIRDLLMSLTSRPLPLEKIETRLFDLTQRVDNLSLAGASSDKSKDIKEAVSAIRSIVATETSQSFHAFNQRLEQLGRKLDDVLAKTSSKRFDELNERIDHMHKSLAQRIDRTAATQKPADTDALENLVAKLAKKIDAALDPKATNPAFDELGRKIEKLEARLQDPAAAASISRIEAMLVKPGEERHFSDLAQRIDLIHKALSSRVEANALGRDGADARHIEQLVDRLGDRIDAALAPNASRRDFDQLENQIEQVSLKLDRLTVGGAQEKLEDLLNRPAATKQIKDIAERIDFMHTALATRIEESVRQRLNSSQEQLNDLVDQLAIKMNAALDPKADASALQSVERQIQLLSQRLDRNDGNASALTSIERKIADLFARFEENRDVATEAAEAAVRRATQEMLRDAANTAPNGRNALVEQELSDIRKAHEEASDRTHETLSAVHETLERVVDRLAVFEDELTDLRSAPAPAAASAIRPTMPVTPRRAPQREAEFEQPGIDASGFLLEPNAPQSQRDAFDRDGPKRPAVSASPGDRSPSIQTDFIAAARRAAQQAAVDADSAELAHNAKRGGALKEAETASMFAQVGSSLQARKRPILLGLGALVLLIGAYQIAKLGVEGAGRVEPRVQSDASAPDAKAPAPAPQPTPKTASTTPNAAKNATGADTASAPEAGRVPPVNYPPALTLPPGASRGGSGAFGPITGKSAKDAVDTSPTGAITGSALSTQEGVAAIRTLAVQGDSTAQYELAARYAEGRGGVPRDPKIAAQWFEKSAMQGVAPAQYRLGSLYEKGVGVERSYAQARKWYQQAAEAGNARSMHNLAVLAAEGNDGKPDYDVAAEWFRKAAELGVRDSQYNLAILYARGLGVAQSLTNSYMWFAIAADQGDADAAKKRDEVAGRLDSIALAAAKALVESFRPVQPNGAANEVMTPRNWDAIKAPGRPDSKPAGKPKVTQS